MSDPEIEAIRVCYEILSDFDRPAQERALNYLSVRLEREGPAVGVAAPPEQCEAINVRHPDGKYLRCERFYGHQGFHSYGEGLNAVQWEASTSQ